MRKKKTIEKWEKRFDKFWVREWRKGTLSLKTVREFIRKELKKQRKKILNEIKIYSNNKRK